MKLSLTLSILLLFAGGCGETTNSSDSTELSKSHKTEKICTDFVETDGGFIEYGYQEISKICRTDFPEGGVALSCKGNFYVEYDDLVYITGLESDSEKDDKSDDYIYFIDIYINNPHKLFSPKTPAVIDVEKVFFRYRGAANQWIVSNPEHHKKLRGTFKHEVEWELKRTDLTTHEEFSSCNREFVSFDSGYGSWECSDRVLERKGTCEIIEGDFFEIIKTNYANKLKRALELKKEELKEIEKEKEKMKI